MSDELDKLAREWAQLKYPTGRYFENRHDAAEHYKAGYRAAQPVASTDVPTEVGPWWIRLPGDTWRAISIAKDTRFCYRPGVSVRYVIADLPPGTLFCRATPPKE